MTRLPNFFIVGAPKCGTTSLASWLAEHPEIHMSPLKEPHYFSSDIGPRVPECRTAADYERLFRKAGPEHKAIGEASATYLLSKEAVPRIERQLPGSRYIAMVRHPADMALSLHGQLLISGVEDIADFREAWRRQFERPAPSRPAKYAFLPYANVYATTCALGAQIQRLLATVPRERVLIVVFDDLRADPAEVYAQVLRFLAVRDDGRQRFPVQNSARRVRWRGLHKGTQALLHARRSLGVPALGTGLVHKVKTAAQVERARSPLPEDLRDELVRYFSADIELLGRLIDRDLAGWTGSSEAAA